MKRSPANFNLASLAYNESHPDEAKTPKSHITPDREKLENPSSRYRGRMFASTDLKLPLTLTPSERFKLGSNDNSQQTLTLL